jgi:hypothetical protein
MNKISNKGLLRNLVLSVLFAPIPTIIVCSVALGEYGSVLVSAQNNSYTTLCAEEDNINISFTGESDIFIT